MIKRIKNFFVVLFIITSTSVALSYQKDAPSFALFSTEGKLITLSSEIQKNNVLLIFFASYCAPCKKEIPELIQVHDKYKDLYDIVFINIDKSGKPEAEKILNELGIENYLCLLDIYQQTIKKYSPALSVPAFFFIHKNGKIGYESIGYKAKSIESFEKYLKKH